MNKILLFAIAVLLSYPMVSAKITEIETSCKMFECYTLLETDFPIDDKLVSKEYFVDLQNKEANNIDVSFNLDSRSKKIKNMNLEVVDKNHIKVYGKIEGASQNYWGLEAFGDSSFWGSTWWNSSFGKKVNLTVTNPGGQNVVNVYVPYDTDMNANFTDLRFLNKTEDQELDYWIEYKSDSNYAWVWVELDINSTDQIYMYYNNPLAVVSTSNGINTFPYFDDWETYTNESEMEAVWTQDSGDINLTSLQDFSLWGTKSMRCQKTSGIGRQSVFDNPIMYISFWVKADTTGGPSESGFVAISDGSTRAIPMYCGYPTANYWGYKAGASYYTSGVPCTANTWTNIVIKLNATSDTWDLISENVTYNSSIAFENAVATPEKIQLGQSGAETEIIWYDSFFVFEWVDPFPIVTFGTEETAPTTTSTSSTTLAITGDQYISYFCQLSDQLVKNTTEWNGTDFISFYNITICPYNCSDSVLGVRCNYSDSVNGIIVLLALLFSLFILVYCNKLLRGLI